MLSRFQVSKNGLTNSVFTLYELVSGDDTAEEGNAMSRVPQQLFRARLIQIPKEMISWAFPEAGVRCRLLNFHTWLLCCHRGSSGSLPRVC